MTKIRIVSAIVMVGLIMPVSFMANIQDVLQGDAITNLQEELDGLIDDYESIGVQLDAAIQQYQATHSDADKAEVNKLIIQRMRKLIEIDRVRLAISKIKIDAIAEKSHPFSDVDLKSLLTNEWTETGSILDTIEDALDDLAATTRATGGDIVLLKTSRAVVLVLDTPAEIREALVRAHKTMVGGLVLKLRAVNLYEIRMEFGNLLYHMTRALDSVGLWNGGIFNRVTNDGWGAVNPVGEEAQAAYNALDDFGYESDLDEVGAGQEVAKAHLRNAGVLIGTAKDVLKELKREAEGLLASHKQRQLTPPSDSDGDEDEDEDGARLLFSCFGDGCEKNGNEYSCKDGFNGEENSNGLVCESCKSDYFRKEVELGTYACVRNSTSSSPSGAAEPSENSQSGDSTEDESAQSTSAVGECRENETKIVTETQDSRGAIWRCVPNTYYITPNSTAPKVERPQCTQGKELTFKSGEFSCECPAGKTLSVVPGGDRECVAPESEANSPTGNAAIPKPAALNFPKVSNTTNTCTGFTVCWPPATKYCSSSGKWACSCPKGLVPTRTGRCATPTI